ncbi:MAG: family 78 glycoside hydrolase catalytic domain [Chthoniobacteraceae bacterium]
MNIDSPLSGAAWISSHFTGSPRTSAPAPYFRKGFLLKQGVKSATLTATALGLYECEINGRRVGDEVFAPGWTDYKKRVQYQAHDVTDLLREGENVLGAILGDGWYCGFIGWRNRQYYGDRPSFLARLDVVFQDGHTISVVTDGTWKASAGPITESDLLMGEVYDARLELGDWSQPGYDDAAWQSVIVTKPDPVPELDPRSGPPVRSIEEIEPVLMDAKKRIHDFGQNFSGRVRIKVRASRGTVVKLVFAEILDAEGRLYTENLRSARASDYYVCKGEDEEVWEPRFTFHGFRYVEAGGLTEKDSVQITGIVLHSDTVPSGSFRCSHALLNQLQHNIIWGQKSNFLEVPTDCPQRDERLGWTGDAQVFIRTACFNMDVQGFFHKWMRDVRDAQKEAGGIPAVVPSVDFDVIVNQDGGPAWADAVIICPWTIYLCYGDSAILEENYATMQRYMEFMANHRCLGKIRSHPGVDRWGGFGDWLALDGGGQTEGITSKDLIGTAFYAYDASIMARVADVLGRKEEAATYRKLHAEIVEAFRHRFVTPEGFVMPGTQTAYVLALHFDLLPADARTTSAGELVRHIKKKDYHLATGFVGTPYILQVLEEAGYLDVAYKLLEQESFPSWLFPVKNGATTIWERWDGWTPAKGFQDKGMNSFNHYAYGAVGAWMYRTVAGLELDTEEPGYRHIIFRPRPGGTITWAEASLRTPHGETSIRWELKEGEFHVSFSVPDGCRATFEPPPGYEGKVSSHAAGSHNVSFKVPRSPTP